MHVILIAANGFGRTLNNAARRAFRDTDAAKRLTLTVDNGTEFARQKASLLVWASTNGNDSHIAYIDMLAL